MSRLIPAKSIVATFTIIPIEEGKHARVQIASHCEAKPGIAGILDRLLAPAVMRRIFRKQLRLLDVYMQTM